MTPETCTSPCVTSTVLSLQRSRGQMTPETGRRLEVPRHGLVASTEPGPDDPGDAADHAPA